MVQYLDFQGGTTVVSHWKVLVPGHEVIWGLCWIAPKLLGTSLPESNGSHLKHWGWKMGGPIFRCENVTFRGCNGVPWNMTWKKFWLAIWSSATFTPSKILGIHLKIYPPWKRTFSHLKIGLNAPKGKDHLPTQLFQVRTVSFSQGICFFRCLWWFGARCFEIQSGYP